MTKAKLPEPGFYSYKGGLYEVIDPSKLPGTGAVLVKDADSGNWSEGVPYRSVLPGGGLFVRTAADFNAKFKRDERDRAAITADIQAAERAESERLVAEATPEAE